MSGQLELSAEQVISAIHKLDPVEKAKVQRHLLILFNVPEYMIPPENELLKPITEKKQKRQYAFAKVRHILREVSGPLSNDVVAEREDRF